MLKPVPMAHFRVQVPSHDAPAVTRVVAGEGLLHLVDIAHGRTPYDAAPSGTRELYAAFRDLSARVRVVCDRLELKLPEPEGTVSDDVDDFAAEREKLAVELEPVEKKVDVLWRELAAARDLSAAAREHDAIAARLREADVDITRLTDLRFATVRLALAKSDSLESIAAMLAPAPFVIVPLDSGEPMLVAIAIANFARSRLDEALRVTMAQSVGTAPAEGGGLEARPTREIAADLARLRDESAKHVATIAHRAESASLLLSAQTHFAAAGRFVVISGWVPIEDAERMRKRIRDVTGDRAVVDVEAAEAIPGVSEGSIRVPILHRNPLLLRPFQRLVDLYGTPSYAEVQPTAFFAIGFLLMFGLMFGDAGHGVVLFSAGWCLFRFIPQYLDYGILLMEAGASSTLFGILYGSFFGIRGLLPVLWLEPMADLQHFMFIAAGLGVVVVSGGLALNVINTWRSGNVREALLGTRGLTGALLYWVALVVLVRVFVPKNVIVPNTIIAVLTVIVIAILISGRAIARHFEPARAKPPVRTTPVSLAALETSVELVDTLFSYFANTISFVRVAAFAAVHAGVFIAIFALADTLSKMRGGGVLAVLVHVAGNIIVILLEGLTVSVQVLRLEYYEFFGKFFRGGGEPYLPLMLRRDREAPKRLESKHA